MQLETFQAGGYCIPVPVPGRLRARMLSSKPESLYMDERG